MRNFGHIRNSIHIRRGILEAEEGGGRPPKLSKLALGVLKTKIAEVRVPKGGLTLKALATRRILFIFCQSYHSRLKVALSHQLEQSSVLLDLDPISISYALANPA
jgi:hypothetical protein